MWKFSIDSPTTMIDLSSAVPLAIQWVSRQLLLAMYKSCLEILVEHINAASLPNSRIPLRISGPTRRLLLGSHYFLCGALNFFSCKCTTIACSAGSACPPREQLFKTSLNGCKRSFIWIEPKYCEDESLNTTSSMWEQTGSPWEEQVLPKWHKNFSNCIIKKWLSYSLLWFLCKSYFVICSYTHDVMMHLINHLDLCPPWVY